MDRWLALVCLTLSATLPVLADPLSDLASPSSEVRAHAAEMIRDNHLYKATPRAPWDEMASTFKAGDSLHDILQLVQKKGGSTHTTADMFAASGVFGFQLDDCWLLWCAFKNSKLVEYKIVEEPKVICVVPPSGYNGLWRTYRIDGESAGADYYQSGKILGMLY